MKKKDKKYKLKKDLITKLLNFVKEEEESKKKKIKDVNGNN